MAQRIAYLDCHSGVSGDMLLGSLLDLDEGFSLEMLREALQALPVSDYELQWAPYQDKGITGSRFDVVLTGQQQPVRSFSSIAALLQNSQLSPWVRDKAIAVFRTLGEAEARIHGVSLEEIHFHEVGAVDAIVDIVGNIIALEQLGITQLYASPLPLSHGHMHMAHGLMPLPAPATLEILRKVKAPWVPCPLEGEFVTPTGAALLATLATFETPAIAITKVGYGFGKKKVLWPNCLRTCLGETYGATTKQDQHDHHEHEHHDHHEHNHA
ncbi:MAG TPA: LarC family nickel insertion protein [Dictyobacter sp.]|nr:LarC family nickel insertion protein [Dictyobacter sp.]